MLVQKRQIFPQKSQILSQKSPVKNKTCMLCTYSGYIWCVGSTESYISTKKPNISAKEPCKSLNVIHICRIDSKCRLHRVLHFHKRAQHFRKRALHKPECHPHMQVRFDVFVQQCSIANMRDEEAQKSHIFPRKSHILLPKSSTFPQKLCGSDYDIAATRRLVRSWRFFRKRCLFV